MGTRSEGPVGAGSGEGVKCFQPSHTPVLNTSPIVHTDRLLAQEEKKEFPPEEKKEFPLFVFP